MKNIEDIIGIIVIMCILLCIVFIKPAKHKSDTCKAIIIKKIDPYEINNDSLYKWGIDINYLETHTYAYSIDIKKWILNPNIIVYTDDIIEKSGAFVYSKTDNLRKSYKVDYFEGKGIVIVDNYEAHIHGHAPFPILFTTRSYRRNVLVFPN